MVLIFFIKLIVANFIHSVSLGLVSLCAIPFFMLCKGDSQSENRNIKKMLLGISLALPFVVLLPIVTAKATHLALVADNERYDFLWWLVALLGGVAPVAISRNFSDPEEEVSSGINIVFCIITFAVFAIWNPSLPSFLSFIERLAKGLAV